MKKKSRITIDHDESLRPNYLESEYKLPFFKKYSRIQSVLNSVDLGVMKQSLSFQFRSLSCQLFFRVCAYLKK